MIYRNSFNQTHLIPVFVHGHFDDVTLERLENGFPILGVSVPERLHGDPRTLVRVQDVDERLARMFDHFLARFRFAENSREAEEFQSRFLNYLMRKRLLFNMTEDFSLEERGGRVRKEEG